MDDPRLKRRLFASLPLRVSGSVPVLVVQLNGCKKRRETLNAFENSPPDHRMLLDNREFFVGKTAGFLQHTVRDTDLSHVVKERSNANPLNFIRVETHCLGCRAG